MLQAGDPLPGEAPDDAGAEDRDGRLAVFDEALANVRARVQPAYRQADDWLEQTRAGLIELLRYCDEQPDTARALVVESIAWGPELLERRGQVLDALAEVLESGRAGAGDCSPVSNPAPAKHPAIRTSPARTAPTTAAQISPEAVPPAVAENLVGACISLVHTRLLQQEHGSFVELAPSLMIMIAHPYLGPEAARRELERSSTHASLQDSPSSPDGVAVGVRGRSY